MGNELFMILKKRYGSIVEVAKMSNCSRQLVRQVLVKNQPSEFTAVILENAKHLATTILSTQIDEYRQKVAAIQEEIKSTTQTLQKIAA